MSPRPVDQLTPAEEAVAKLVAEGWSNAEIASRRHSSVRAVETLVTLAARKIPGDGRPRVKLARRFGAVPRETFG